MPSLRNIVLLLWLLSGLMPSVQAAAGERPVVIAAVPRDFPPQYHVHDDGSPGGFAVEVMNAIAARAGVSVVYRVKDTWSEVEGALATGEADLIPNVGVTDEWARQGLHTAPVESVRISIFVHADNTAIGGVDDLDGKTVAVLESKHAEHVLATGRDITLRMVTSVDDGISALEAGDVDAFALSVPTLWSVAERRGLRHHFKTVGAALGPVDRAILVRKDRVDLANLLGPAVRSFVGGPEYQAIHEKWYGKPAPYWDRDRVALAVAAAVLAVLVLAGMLRFVEMARVNRRLATANQGLRAAEEERRRSEERFRVLAEAAPVGIFRLDPAGEVVYANPAWRSIMGSVEDGGLKCAWRDLLHPDDLERAMFDWAQARTAGAAASMEFRLRHGRQVVCQVSPIRGAGGVAGQIGTLTDITALKELSELLRTSEEKFRTLIEFLPQAVFVVVDGRCIYANPAGIQMMRAPAAADQLGRPVTEFIHPDFHDQARDVMEGLMRGEEKAASFGESRLRRLDGTSIYVNLALTRTDWERGPAILAVAADITLQRRAERALKMAEERMRLALTGANDGLWDWDMTTDRVYYSPRWKTMLGHAEDEVGDSLDEWRKRVHPDDLSPAQAAIDAYVEGRAPKYEVEFRMRHKDGHDVDILTRGILQRDESGRPVRMVGTHVDMTERKRTERTLRRLNRARETITACNAVLVRATDEDMLLKDVCAVIVDTGEFPLAWVGYVERDAAKTVRPVAVAGPARDYLDGITVRWGDDAYGRGPSGTGIRTGRIQVVVDTLQDPEFEPWRERAVRWSLRSFISVPLTGDDGAFGTLNVYSGDANAFDAEEVRLLDELGSDLAYGIRMLRTQTERDVARASLEEALLQTIEAIALTVEKRDPYTAGHQHRVAKLAVAIARELGWSESRIEGVRLGATIHDIGKIYIPSEILNRPGRLTEHEFGLIQSHPQVGFDIVAGVSLPMRVKQMILQHHERLDGSGYPNGLAGDAIVVEARVLAVADVVEAITSHRPYRPSIGVAAGLAEIERGRGVHYDPEVVDACTRLFRIEGFRWDGPHDTPLLALATPAHAGA